MAQMTCLDASFGPVFIVRCVSDTSRAPSMGAVKRNSSISCLEEGGGRGEVGEENEKHPLTHVSSEGGCGGAFEWAGGACMKRDLKKL